MAATKPRRTLRVCRTGNGCSVLVIEGKTTTAYDVDTIGGAVVVYNRTKGKTYDIACKGGEPAGCTCDGGKFRPWARCKHRALVAKLADLGHVLLDGPPDGFLHTTESE